MRVSPGSQQSSPPGSPQSGHNDVAAGPPHLGLRRGPGRRHRATGTPGVHGSTHDHLGSSVSGCMGRRRLHRPVLVSLASCGERRQPRSGFVEYSGQRCRRREHHVVRRVYQNRADVSATHAAQCGAAALGQRCRHRAIGGEAHVGHVHFRAEPHLRRGLKRDAWWFRRQHSSDREGAVAAIQVYRNLSGNVNEPSTLVISRSSDFRMAAANLGGC